MNRSRHFLCIRMAAAIMMIILVWALAGCSTSQGKADSTAAEGTTADRTSDMDSVKNRGTVRIGVLAGSTLFYQEKNGGEWLGFGADLARNYVSGLKLEAEFVPLEADQAEEMLENGNVDCIWGRNAWTEAQKASLSFSRPYLKNKLAIVVHFKNKDKDKCRERDKLTQMKEFVVVEGSPGEAKAKELGANYSTEKDIIHCFLRVAAGTASCALVDVFDSTSMIGDGTQYENLVYTVTFDLEEFSVGFRKDSDLIPSLDSFFASSYKDGSTGEIARKYRISKMIMEVK